MNSTGNHRYCTAIYFNLSDRCVHDHDWLRKGIRDVASKGFNVIYFQPRDSVYEPMDAEMVEALRVAVKECHRYGIKAWAGIVPDSVAGPVYYVKKYPTSLQKIINSFRVAVVNGSFRCPLDMTDRFGYRFDDIIRAFMISEGQKPKDVSDKISFSYECEPSFTGTSSVHNAMPPFVQGYVTGKVKGMKDGTLLLYTQWDPAINYFPRIFDYSSKAPYKYAEELLTMYSNIPLDGIGWDEPGVSCTWSFRKSFGGVSESYFKRFKKTYGYDLRDYMYAIEGDFPETNCGLIRYHHFKMLGDMLLDIEGYLKKRAKETFGTNMDMGVHQTLHETCGDDLFHGSIDVFRLRQALTGGFTDSFFEMDAVMFHSIVLARSLSRKTESGQAWNNSWGFHPKESQIDFYTRLMSINNVSWLAHLYGHTGCFGPGYPEHSTWGNMGRYVTRLKKFSDFLDGAMVKADVAMLYTWEGTADLGDYDYMHIHRESDTILIKRLVLDNVGIEIIGAQDLVEGKIQGKALLINGQEFKILLVPWPVMLQPSVWKKIKEFAATGGRIVFSGPPAHQDTNGKDLALAFSKLVGIEQISLSSFKLIGKRKAQFKGQSFGFAPEKGEPNYYWQPERYYPQPRFYPIKTLSSKAIVKIGDEVAGVQKDNITYLSFEYPLFYGFVSSFYSNMGITQQIDVSGEKIISSVCAKGVQEFLLLSSLENETFFGTVRWQGHTIDLKEVTLVGLEFSKGDFIRAIGDKSQQVLIDGKKTSIV